MLITPLILNKNLCSTPYFGGPTLGGLTPLISNKNLCSSTAIGGYQVAGLQGSALNRI